MLAFASRGKGRLATIADRSARLRQPLAADGLERALGGLSLVLLGVALAALVRGRAHWAEVPLVVWLHLATVLVALVLTPIILLRRRGDQLHRRLGWAWSGAMFGTAAISFGIRFNQQGGLSWIHGLSVAVMLAIPWMIWNARRHDVAKHRRIARALILAGLLTAGFFTFPFERLLGRWLFG